MTPHYKINLWLLVLISDFLKSNTIMDLIEKIIEK
jgi:hypothetical protein